MDRAGWELSTLLVHGAVTGEVEVGGLTSDDAVRRFSTLMSEAFPVGVPIPVTGLLVRNQGAGAGAVDLAVRSMDLPLAQAAPADRRPFERSAGIAAGPWSKEPPRPQAPSAALTVTSTRFQFPRAEVEVGEGGARTFDYTLWPVDRVGDREFRFDRTQFNDFGYEFDVKQYRDGPPIPTVRPDCLPGNDQLFWGARLGLSENPDDILGLFSSVPTAARPYHDSNDYTDSCDTLDHSAGIGRPDLLPNIPFDQAFNFFVTVPIGNSDGNVISVKHQIISNDCNDISAPENSNCMGLWFGRPGSDSEVPIDVNADAVSVPFCEPSFGSYGKAVGFAEEMWRQLGWPDSYLINCGVER